MRFLLGVLMLMISGSALATIDVLQFKDEAQEQQFRQLTEELRCPKCQNNSIADSNSMIATDLRQKVYELMQEGKSKKEIVDYMVARYGNFVTYDPPLTPLTVLLWVLPVVAIGIGGWVIYARSRRRVRVVPEAFPEQSVQEGKRAGYIVYLPGIVVALIVAGVSYYQTGNYQQVKNTTLNNNQWYWNYPHAFGISIANTQGFYIRIATVRDGVVCGTSNPIYVPAK